MSARADHRLIADAAYAADDDTEVALAFGCTREWVRQCRSKFYDPAEIKRVRRERKAARIAVAERPIEGPAAPCRVCGTKYFEWDRPGPTGVSATCSHECKDAWVVLRYHCGDFRERHRVHVVNWVLKNSDDPVARRNAQRTLDGTAGTHGQWLSRGSKAHGLALRSLREGWPIYEKLTPPIQEQVRAEVGA